MRVLLLTGESEFASAIGTRLREEGQSVETAGSADDATTAAQEGRFDLILAETGGVGDGLGFLRRYRSARGMVPLIILGPSPAEQTGREALREGAIDCIARTAAMDEVSLRCRQAHDRERLRAEAAAATSPMLVTGARGVGKTALAPAAHRLSARCGRTLSMFDCSLRSAAEIAPPSSRMTLPDPASVRRCGSRERCCCGTPTGWTVRCSSALQGRWRTTSFRCC